MQDDPNFSKREECGIKVLGVICPGSHTGLWVRSHEFRIGPLEPTLGPSAAPVLALLSLTWPNPAVTCGVWRYQCPLPLLPEAPAHTLVSTVSLCVYITSVK